MGSDTHGRPNQISHQQNKKKTKAPERQNCNNGIETQSPAAPKRRAIGNGNRQKKKRERENKTEKVKRSGVPAGGW
jgi:hypothetical protein